MADSINIVLKMNEDVSSKMKTIESMSQGCSKEMEQLGRKAQQLGERYDYLNKHAAEAAGKAADVKRNLDAAKKLMKETGCAANEVDFTNLKEQYDALSDSASTYQKQARSALKEANDSYEDFRKMDLGLDVPASAKSIAGKVEASLGDKLAQSGLFKMFGDSLAVAAGVGLESAVGQPMAALGSSVASGIASGAAAGALFGNPLLGAGLGAASGLISGGAQLYAQKDDAFKEYYRNLYATGGAGTEESLQIGSTIAGSREQTQMAFTQRLGSDEAATAYLDRTREMAKETNYTFDEITGYSKRLLNSYDPDAVFGVLGTLSDASAGLDLTSSDVEQFISGLSRMRTSNKATREYLNYFSERGVDVDQALSETTGVSKSQVGDMISSGKISGELAAQSILDFLNRSYGGLSEKLAGSYDAMTNNLGDVMAEIQVAGGAAYDEERKESVGAGLEAYSGALGDKLAELSAATGKVEAYGENMRDQFQREALSAVLLGEKTTAFSSGDAEKLESLRAQYQESEEAWNGGSMEAGQRMTDLKEEAEALATAAFESSDWSEKLHQAELDQIDATRELIDGLSAATNALEINNAFTKGGAAGYGANPGNGSLADGDVYNGVTGAWEHYDAAGNREKVDYNSSHAFGLRRVPDTGLYLLHRDESVQTAAETREKGGASGVTITGNAFHVRQESDVPAIASELLRQMELAQLRAE